MVLCLVHRISASRNLNIYTMIIKLSPQYCIHILISISFNYTILTLLFKICPGKDGKLHTNIVCPVDLSQQPEGTLPDIQSTEYAINFLKNHSSYSNTKNQPFFLAVGYHKPHIPLKFPKKFLDLYPIEKIHIATDPLRPLDMPSVAYEPWTDIRWRDDIAALNLKFPYARMPDYYAKQIRQSYYAATSYVDSLIGELLGALENYGFGKNTIVTFIGDHGTQLWFYLVLCWQF